MKNKLLHFCFITLGSVLIFFVINSFTSKAVTSTDSKIDYSDDLSGFLQNFCEFGDGNFDNMEVDDLRAEYLKSTNDFFNKYIAKLMNNETESAKAPADAAKGNPPNPLSVPPSLDALKNPGNLKAMCPDGDYGCSMLYACNEDTGDNPGNFNYSTYCLAQNALGFSARNAGKMRNLINDPHYAFLKKSYFCYSAALTQKTQTLKDYLGGTQLNKCDQNDPKKNQSLCSDFDKLKPKAIQMFGEQNFSQCMQDASTVCFNPNLMLYKGEVSFLSKSEMTDYYATLDQLQKNLEKLGYSNEIVTVTTFINRDIDEVNQEIVRSKQVLDQTLSAYSQLQTAWKMHVRYAEIINMLVKYRDAVVAVRKQTDAFPLKFIDASTTRCL